MERIRNEDLNNVVARINRLMGANVEACKTGGVGVFRYTHWNVGTYILDWQSRSYVKLELITSESGSTSHVIEACTKREMYNQLFAFIAGIEAMQAQVLSELKPLKLGDVIKTGGVFLFDKADTNQGETK